MKTKGYKQLIYGYSSFYLTATDSIAEGATQKRQGGGGLEKRADKPGAARDRGLIGCSA